MQSVNSLSPITRPSIDSIKPALQSIVVGVISGAIAGQWLGLDKPWLIGGMLGLLDYLIHVFLQWVFSGEHRRLDASQSDRVS
jgi:hypothetical protein